MNRFKVKDIKWKEFPMHPDKFDGYQLSLKCTVEFDKKIEIDAESNDIFDDKFCFNLIALDEEGYAILEVEFWDCSLPKVGTKSRTISKRFSCEKEEFDLIHSWVLK